jgi:hypothetical protein
VQRSIFLLILAIVSLRIAVAEPCKNLEFSGGSSVTYPAIALASNISGTVKLMLHLDGSGTVTSIDLLSSSSKFLEGGTKGNAGSLKFFWPTSGTSALCEQIVEFRYQVLPDTAESGYLRATFESGSHIVIEAKRHPPTVNY